MNRPVTCAVLDDEAPARHLLCQYIAMLPHQLELIGSFENPEAFQKERIFKEVELLFLDIRMPGYDGFELLNFMHKRPQVIVITAYDEYALKGYTFNLVDYILKPASFERFAQAVNKAVEMIQWQSNINNEVMIENDFFWLRSDRKLHKIYLNDIEYIESSKEFLIVHLTKSKLIIRLSFNQLFKLLPENRFIQIHKSYAISIEKIKSFSKTEVVISKKTLPVGQKFRTRFLEQLKIEPEGQLS
ncbi:MAG: response regulator transcription factor [Bacteroidetes Order II. Incertae sedis bacterium]|nr:response regulator transcription factor [Bacteroidetes Order II. bacterium]